MKGFLLAAALAVPVSAQVAAPDQNADISGTADAAKALAKKLKPAAVDPKPVAALTDRLSKEGAQLATAAGEIYNVLSRQTAPDASGRFRVMQANLVELPASAVEPPSKSMYRDLVLRRYFSRLEATSDDWAVDPKTGIGQVEEWHFVLSLDGKLISAERALVPVRPVGPGDAEPDLKKAKIEAMAPSDPAVQKRWKDLSKELQSLSRTYSV